MLNTKIYHTAEISQSKFKGEVDFEFRQSAWISYTVWSLMAIGNVL